MLLTCHFGSQTKYVNEGANDVPKPPTIRPANNSLMAQMPCRTRLGPNYFVPSISFRGRPRERIAKSSLSFRASRFAFISRFFTGRNVAITEWWPGELFGNIFPAGVAGSARR
jgi:hypothetical protein